MSSPTHNSVGFTNLSTAGLNSYVAALIGGAKWGGGWNTGVTLTYSFLSGNSWYESGYGSGEISATYQLASDEQAAARSAMAVWASFANIHFQQVTDSYYVAGDIRFGQTTIVSGSESAHAYLPSGTPEGGDVWLNYNGWHNPYIFGSVIPGTYDYLVLLHELGHALGLKHSFEGPHPIASAYDNYSFTIMSYSAEYSGGGNFATFYPMTPMYYDIAAMQAMYGRASHNSGNTTYYFDQSANYWLTIDDSAGKDTIVSIGFGSANIDLRSGHFSSLGQAVQYGSGNLDSYLVCIGPGTKIENATGGSGPDTIHGNGYSNKLLGNAGDDLIFGLGGKDTINGGPGSDIEIGGGGKDTFLFDINESGIIDFIVSYKVRDDTIKLARHVFTDLGGNGVLTTVKFFKGAAAHDLDDRVIYDPTTGLLFYDENGSTLGGEHAIAFLNPNLKMTHAEFIVVA